MSESIETKVCPMCAEAVKTSAKVCPHCHQWLRWWSLRNPHAMGVMWLGFCVFALLAMGVFCESKLNAKRNFRDYCNQFAVSNSAFSLRQSGSNMLVSVVGTVTNGTTFAWKDVQLEAQFFDRSGRLIDVISQVSDYSGVALLPHGEAGFKLEGKAVQFQSEYVSHKVFVRWAKDPDAWP